MNTTTTKGWLLYANSSVPSFRTHILVNAVVWKTRSPFARRSINIHSSQLHIRLSFASSDSTTAALDADQPTDPALIVVPFVATPLKSHCLVHTSDTTSTSRF